MIGFAVYIGDFAAGNGSTNPMCGNPSWARYNTIILIDCTDTLVGKYLYVAAADRPGAALYLNEVIVNGCEGECACLNCFEFVLSNCRLP